MSFAAAALAWLLPTLRALWGCKRCMIGLAFVAVAVTSNQLGQHKARVECQEAQLRAKLANKQADLDNARKSAADATLRADLIERNASEQSQKDADYIASLEARPIPAACLLTDDDINSLPNHRKRNGARSAPAR